MRLDLQTTGNNARNAARVLALSPTGQKNAALIAAASAMRKQQNIILEANRIDVLTAELSGKPAALVDRLSMTAPRIEAMAASVEEIATLPDPVGEITSAWERPNGLAISRVRVPLGVVGIVYESRPNVTADAGALCLKSGNAVILRGGSDAMHSSRAIHACLAEGLRDADLPVAAIQLVQSTDRDAVGQMLEGLGGTIDVLVPRGGRSLVERVQREARVPVFAHLEGICHVYVDKAADLRMACGIVLNAKMRRTGICGAAETLLIDEAGADTLLVPLVKALLDAGCEVRGDDVVQRADTRTRAATEQDWRTEYLDATISIRTVAGVQGAMDHIARYGSQHTEAIVTEDATAAGIFLREIDSAIVMHNASTQFADGGEFGMGAEIGIATGRFHARGPVGLEQLCTFKYVVRGNGQTRAV